jgi:hypothetical protein
MSDLTLRDHQRIPVYEHDEELNAKRVVIVGGPMPQFKMQEFKQVESKVQIVEVPVIVEKEKIVYVDKPYIIEKIAYERIEVPFIVKEIVYERSEAATGVSSTFSSPTIVEVEKTVFVPKTEYKDLPVWIRASIAAQVLVSIIALLKIVIGK